VTLPLESINHPTMSYPPRLRSYREILASRRCEPQNLHEVLILGSLCCFPKDETRITRGIVNHGNTVWALSCENKDVSFVWDVGKRTEGKTENHVTGAKCFSEWNSSGYQARHRNLIGITSLSSLGFEEAGTSKTPCAQYVVGKFVCDYFGCHHVLWNYQEDFIDALLYLVLDDPKKREPFKFLDRHEVRSALNQ
jgi:hypothetical protein